MRADYVAAVAVSALALAAFSTGVWAVDVKLRGAGPPPWENITFPVVHYLAADSDGFSPAAGSAGGEKAELSKEGFSPVYAGYVVIYADGFFYAKFVGPETRKDIQTLFDPYEEPLRISYYVCGFGGRGLREGRWDGIQRALTQLGGMRVGIFYSTDGVWPFPDWGPVFIRYCRENILQFLSGGSR